LHFNDNTDLVGLSIDSLNIINPLLEILKRKVDTAAPKVVFNFIKYMGGVDKHDKLWNTFALGKCHKFKKYYMKLLFFLMDIA
jgi:hypothetical protein